MNLNDLFDKSQVVTDLILGQLDAKSLALLGSCNRYLRSLTNNQTLWHSLCQQKGYTQLNYLLEFSNHPLLPPISRITPSPIYFQFDTETLEELNKWREVYNRGEHLKFNWRQGVYFVLPLLKGHKHPVSAFDSNGCLVASGSDEERLIKIWSVEECECVTTIRSRAASVNCLKWCGERVVAAGDDGIVRVYDAREGDLLFTLVAGDVSANAQKMLVAGDNILVVFSDL